jgi:hypothetical protein
MTRIQRRAQALLAVAALGAAGMFVGGEGWPGVDLGAIGGALLYMALWVFVILLANHDAGEVFPEAWSLTEKQAWVSLVFVTLFGFHMLNLLAALPGLGLEADRMRNSATRPLWAQGMLALAWIVVSSLLRKQDAGNVGLVERDARILHSASRVADGTTTALILSLVVALIALPEYSRTWLRPLIAANVLVALLIARALVENLYTVLRYQRDRG